MAEDKVAKAYMIHDPVEDKWYRTNTLGFVSWDVQVGGAIWTLKEEVDKIVSRMRGTRAKRLVVKSFLLIPVDN